MSGRLLVNSRNPRYFSNTKSNERRSTPGNSSSSKFVIEITEPDSVGGTPFAKRGDSYTPTHSLMKTANSPKVISNSPNGIFQRIARQSETPKASKSSNSSTTPTTSSSKLFNFPTKSTKSPRLPDPSVGADTGSLASILHKIGTLSSKNNSRPSSKAVTRSNSKRKPAKSSSQKELSGTNFSSTFTKQQPEDRSSDSSGLCRSQTFTAKNADLKDKTRSLDSLVTQVKSAEQVKRPKGADLTPVQLKEQADRIYKEHLFQTFQAIKFIRSLPPADPAQLRAKKQDLPKRPGYENKKTVVFDLDETLVHCCESIERFNPDVVLPVRFPTGDVVNVRYIQAGINIRPYAREVLREANKDYEVIVFTASHQCYADVVLDYLDPTRELIHHRLYRDNCIITEGIFIKDLRVLNNRRIQDIIIIDNAAYSFGYQLDNGIPIISWHDDKYDKELYNLIDYLKALSRSEDIRDVNRQTFRLRSFYDDYIEQFLSPSRSSKASSPREMMRQPKTSVNARKL